MREILDSRLNRMALTGREIIFILLVFPGVAVCFPIPASAQVGTALQNFTVQTWTVSDGLPEQSIQALAQTADRYLWVGTVGGLVRFDGSSFTTFSRHNTPEIRENKIFSLFASSDGSLWIGTEGAGALRYSHGSFERFAEQQGVTNGFVRSILEDTKGTIWLGTDDGVFRLGNGQFKRVDGTSGFPAITVHAILETHDGSIWIAGSRLVRWKDSVAEDWPLGKESTQTAIKAMLEVPNGSLYLGSVNGLYEIPSTTSPVRSEPRKVPGVSDTIRSLHQDASGDLWIATTKHGVLVYHNGRALPLKLTQSSAEHGTYSIFEDRDHSLWIGMQTGLARLRHTAITTVPIQGADESDFGTVYDDPQGTMWFAYSHLYQYAKNRTTHASFPAVGSMVIHNVLHDSSGAFWIGTDGQGVFRLSKGEVSHYTIANGLVNNFVEVMTQDGQGGVWIGTDGGLSHWYITKGKGFTISTILGYTAVHDILAEDDKGLWIAVAEGVRFFHNGAFEENLVTNQLKQEKVMTIFEDSAGGLWFGTEDNGVFRWKNGLLSHFTRNDGLPTDQVYKILEDRSQRIWLSSSNGVSSLDLSSFDGSQNQRSGRLPVTFYAAAEDMQCTQIYGGVQPAGFVARDGHVWFPGVEGPIRMPLKAEMSADTGPVVVDGVIVNGRAVDAGKRLILQPDTSRVEFHFTTVLPQSPERIRYRYKLFGFDPDWTDASGERTADYTNLPPGSYVFHVTAYDLNNPVGATEATLMLKQEPHLYRTSWFIGACILMAVLIAFSGNRIYVRNLQARYEGILQERTRLARELHDTLIQGCNTVSALLDASSLTQGTSSESLLMHAREQIRTTTENTRRTVWNLRNERSHEHFDRALDSLVGNFRKDFELPVELNISGRPFHISKECEHELMMVMREALYNSARHSHASNVRVDLKYDSTGLVLELADNGLGFDVAEVIQRGNLHYGLKGLRERIARIKGYIAIQSAIGQGTMIRVSLSRGKAAKARWWKGKDRGQDQEDTHSSTFV